MTGREDSGIWLGFEGPRAVVALHGELDVLFEPRFIAVMDLAVDDERTDVVLDLAKLRFIDAAGIRVVAAVARRMRAAGRELVVRDAPALTLRLLEITGVSTLVTFAEAAPVECALAPEEAVGDSSASVGGNELDLVAALSRAGSLPASSAVIDGALRLVVALTQATVDGADGVSVTLERHGVMSTAAASHPAVEVVDGHQYATGQGPCLAAKEEGRWFHVESLAEEDRWPDFISLAIEDGIRSILSTPLMSADRPIGSLNIYSNTEGSFGSREQELAVLFATQASGILIDGQADASADETAARISAGLQARACIAHAEGILMARRRVDPEQASLLLFRAARTAELTVLEQAGELIAEAHGQTGKGESLHDDG